MPRAKKPPAAPPPKPEPQPTDGEIRNRIIGFEFRPADSFLVHDRNWREHPPEQRSAVSALLDDLGWIGAVTENKRTGKLVDGHERIWQALERGDREPVPVLIVDLDESEELEALLGLDSTTEMANPNRERLASLVEEVKARVESAPEPDERLRDLMKSVRTRHGLTESGGSGGGSGEDKGGGSSGGELITAQMMRHAAELVGELGIEPGILFSAGRHRIMCGDPRTEAHLARLIQGLELDLLHVDPPRAAFDPVPLLVLARHSIIWGGNRFADALPVSDSWLVWNLKENAERGEFGACELAWTNLEIPSRVYHHATAALPEPAEDGEPTPPVEKPVELFEAVAVALNFADDTSTWLDPFARSGAQVIAAEHLGATCFALEAEPLYVALMIERLRNRDLEVKKIPAGNRGARRR